MFNDAFYHNAYTGGLRPPSRNYIIWLLFIYSCIKSSVKPVLDVEFSNAALIPPR